MAELAVSKKACAAVDKDVLARHIAELEEPQRKTVLACFAAATAKNKKGRRYTLEWIYECVLMRIKASSLYDSMRERNILPLPCKYTLNKYIHRITSSAFGFPQAVFDCLRVKASGMSAAARRGMALKYKI